MFKKSDVYFAIVFYSISMEPKKVYRTIGLMSGTSLDGMDAALIETDGHGFVRPLGFASFPYEDGLRSRLRACFGRAVRDDEVLNAEQDLTRAHIEILQSLDWRADLIGFHGQTIHHDPSKHMTVQIGDGALMARETGIDVVNDFRSADVRAGGEGAPLIPLYHQALVMAAALARPLAVLNIGGVSNLTGIGTGENDILAFDTGPGNALLDDFVLRRTGKRFDENGALARSGTANETMISAWLEAPYFKKSPPKSLDRDAWDVTAVQNLGDADGAATLATFTVRSIAAGVRMLPAAPREILVTGGGRLNGFLMGKLAEVLGIPVRAVESAGWNGDALEAEGFAYLAVRSLLGLPLSLPSTTGVPAPQTGGVLHKSAPTLEKLAF
jgi:anhydro-N-acetylmuramic acid kinase